MMSLSAIGPGLTRFGCTVLQVGKKYAPQIMTYTGIAGFIATVIYACKATTKAEQILAERDKKMAEIEECSENHRNEYSETDREKDIHVVTVQTRWDLVKCYTPVVTLGLASTALILGGHHIIQARSASYAAAFKASEKAFRAYREAVAKKYGEDPEKTYLDVQESDILAREKKKQEMLKSDDPKERKKALTVANDIHQAVWSRETSSQWIESPRLNCYFLKDAMRQCNNYLRTHGFIFLNQVRKFLGLPYIPEGQYVGWILKKHVNDIETDGYVDFLHIDDPKRKPSQSVQDFFDLKNTEYVILDFNHDGDIHLDVGKRGYAM